MRAHTLFDQVMLRGIFIFSGSTTVADASREWINDADVTVILCTG